MNFQVKKKLDHFFTKASFKKYKMGEFLIRAGEKPSGIFYLTSGTVRQYLISGKGDEIVLNIFKPYSFFPMSWALTNSENIYFFEAVSQVGVYKTSKIQILGFIKKNPEILYDLLNRIYIGTEGLLIRMAYLMLGNAYPRVIVELMIKARRFGKVNKKTGAINFKVFEKDIASESGMTRETVSREIKILKDKKLIKFKNNLLTIPNLQELEEQLKHY